MKKMPLKKLFHIDREAYKSEYEKRFNDDDTVHLDIEISGNAAFLCQTKEMFGSIISKYSLQGTTQSRYLTGGVPPVRFSM